LKELIALAKQKPGGLFYGSGGNGASTHLAGELFNMVAGVNIAHVPYKGTGEALSSVMAGTVPLTFTGISSARAPMEAGRLKALAITGSARNAAVPNVPTFDQAGLAGVDSSSQWTVLGPAGMSADVIKKINEAFNQAMKDPAIQKRVDDLGYTVAGGSPVQAGKLIGDEIAKWKKIISAANININ
jgi:tripartite-type tricarboxylate transporter receptor subunit TctC